MDRSRRVNRLGIPLVILMLLLGTAQATSANRPTYPPTRTVDVVDDLHGVKVADPYRWLEDGEKPEVKAWVEQQNVRTRMVLDHLPGRKEIGRRLGELLEIGRISVARPAKGH